jgi:uncharacterized protein YjbI with pentapeptide repeats
MTSEQEQGKEQRFSQKQYEMLKRCSDKKDITEWNEWRDKNPDRDIELENVDFSGWNLKKVNFGTWTYRVYRCRTSKVYLRKAKFSNADLKYANFHFAHLEDVDLYHAHLEEARLSFAHIERGVILGTHLDRAAFVEAHLERANLSSASLMDARLWDAHLEGATIRHADLRGAGFQAAIVDGETSIYFCRVDRHTDFRGVALDSVRILPETKQLLEYNIRRMDWEEWYKEHCFLRWPVRVFWAMSDYGMSTVRVVGVFFILAFLFAAVYANWAYWAPPGIVNDLSVEAHEPIWHYFVLSVVRPVYFSVVTMTTLGFGDMYANKQSIVGHVLLILQVILGYVLLGALVTRFAVLFTAGGPAEKFAKKER